VGELAPLRLAFVEVVEGQTAGARDFAPFDYAALRASSMARDGQQRLPAADGPGCGGIRCGRSRLVGRPSSAPDLVRRLRRTRRTTHSTRARSTVAAPRATPITRPWTSVASHRREAVRREAKTRHHDAVTGKLRGGGRGTRRRQRRGGTPAPHRWQSRFPRRSVRRRRQARTASRKLPWPSVSAGRPLRVVRNSLFGRGAPIGYNPCRPHRRRTGARRARIGRAVGPLRREALVEVLVPGQHISTLRRAVRRRMVSSPGCCRAARPRKTRVDASRRSCTGSGWNCEIGLQPLVLLRLHGDVDSLLSAMKCQPP